MYQASNSGLISTSSRDLNAFKMVKPKTIAEAVSYLNDFDSVPVAYAGGVDLATAYRENKQIGTLVWLKEIDEISNITVSDDNLRIGALVTHGQGSANKKLACVRGLQESWGKIANVRIRFSATIGGNLMALRTSYEMPILLSALKARINFANKDGLFTLAADEMSQTPRLTGALLTSVDIPLKGKPQIDYERSMRPLYTQAAVKFQDGDNSLIRIAIATEHLPPYIFEIPERLEDFDQIFESLPPDYADLRLDNNYIRYLIPVILKRQIKRLAKGQ